MASNVPHSWWHPSDQDSQTVLMEAALPASPLQLCADEAPLSDAFTTWDTTVGLGQSSHTGMLERTAVNHHDTDLWLTNPGTIQVPSQNGVYDGPFSEHFALATLFEPTQLQVRQLGQLESSEPGSSFTPQLHDIPVTHARLDQEHHDAAGTMTFTFNGRPGVPLCLALGDNSRNALQGLSDPGDRSFFDGFGEKATYEIVLQHGGAYRRQKRCKRVKRGTYFYISRLDIVQHVAELTRDLLQVQAASSDFQPDLVVQDNSNSGPSNGQTHSEVVRLEELVLFELRKVPQLKATVQPIFGYLE